MRFTRTRSSCPAGLWNANAGSRRDMANKKISCERGLLQEVVLTQFLQLQNWDPKEGVILTNPHEASIELLDFVLGLPPKLFHCDSTV